MIVYLPIRLADSPRSGGTLPHRLGRTTDRHVRYRQSWRRTTVGDHYVTATLTTAQLDVAPATGPDLFSCTFLPGFDPGGQRDRYTNYFDNNRAITLINHAYCVENPRKFAGYGEDCWGISVGINSGGGKPYPRMITARSTSCGASRRCIYPVKSMRALRYFYRKLGPKVFGIYGFSRDGSTRRRTG